MKKIIKSIIMLGAIALCFPACDLNKTPFDSVATTDSFQTMTDANFQRNGLYSQLRNRQHGIFAGTAEWMTDLFVASPEFGNRGGNPHLLNELMVGDYYGRDIWRNTYSSLAQVNNFIARIEDVEATTDDDKALIANYKAEAHYIRAYMYYILIKYFGVAYDPATAASKPGVPLITTFDPFYRPSRASVADIYQFIVEEIALAEKLTTPGAAESRRITIDAVKAFKSRIQLLMGNYAGAAETAMELINSGRYPLITTPTGLRNYWAQDTGSEDIFKMFVSAVEHGFALVGAQNLNQRQDMLAFKNWLPAQNAHQPDWIPTQTVIDMYETADLRKSAYFHFADSIVANQVIVNAVRCKDLYILSKWPFTAMYGNDHIHQPKVARIAEQYLIAAEALNRSGGDGLAVLNTFRKARGASELPEWNEQELRNEWAREMIGEGVYLTHMKRWGIGFNGRVQQIATNVATGNPINTAFPAAINVVAPPNYYRFTYPIPENELNLNPNMKQTPEWENIQ